MSSFKSRMEFEQVLNTIPDTDVIDVFVRELMTYQESNEIQCRETKYINEIGLTKGDAHFYTSLFLNTKKGIQPSLTDIQRLRHGSRSAHKLGGIAKYWRQL